MLHFSFEPFNEHLAWYRWLLGRPLLHRKQKYEEYHQWSKFSAGKWQLASCQNFVNIAMSNNIVVCSFPIVNSGAIFLFLYIFVPIGTLFQANEFHLCFTATIFTTSYNIQGSCFAVMTPLTANYLLSVLWSCCQQFILYMLWILEWLHMEFFS